MKEFDQFQVPPLLLKELYKETLVALNDRQSPPPEKKTDSVPWQDQALGSHENGLLVLADNPSVAVMAKEDLVYLGNILSACKRSVDESLLINLAGLPAKTFGSWAPKPAPRFVWMIGLEPGQISLPARFPQFQVQVLGDTTYLWTPPLSELKDKEAKTRLWNALKHMFNIA